MGSNNDYQISPIEMGVTLISLIFGVGILTLPRALANRVGTTDGWISILIAGLISMVFIYFYTRLQQNFPNEGLLPYIAKGKFGKWGVKVFAFLFVLYFTTLLALQARILGMAVKMYLINRTPSEVLVAIILLVTTYAASKGLQGIIHIHLMFTPFILLALFTVTLFNLVEAEFKHMSPILREGFAPVLSGIPSPMFSFVGVFILFFFMPYMKASDLRSLPLNIAMMFLMIIYTCLTVITYAVFGFEMSKVITFPAIELAKEIEIIGKFIERLESMFLTIYIMSIFTTMSTVLFVNFKVINEQFLPHSKHSKWVPPFIIFIIYIISFIPDSISSLEKLGEFIAILGDCLLGGGIVIGYMTVWLRKRRKTSIENASQA